MGIWIYLYANMGDLNSDGPSPSIISSWRDGLISIQSWNAMWAFLEPSISCTSSMSIITNLTHEWRIKSHDSTPWTLVVHHVPCWRILTSWSSTSQYFQNTSGYKGGAPSTKVAHIDHRWRALCNNNTSWCMTHHWCSIPTPSGPCWFLMLHVPPSISCWFRMLHVPQSAPCLDKTS